MSLRDYRCALSGVSLLGAEAALILLEKGHGWLPASLPLWGVYDGAGTLGDVQEGPHVDLLVARMQSLVGEGRVSIDFRRMGLAEQALDSIEMILGLIACSQVSELDAFRIDGRPLGFALVSAHVAAELMESESHAPPDCVVEGLVAEVLPGDVGCALYADFPSLPIKTRLRFGLSFVGLFSLLGRARDLKAEWQPAGVGLEPLEGETAMYLTEAMLRFRDDEQMLLALEEYAGQFAEETEPG